MKTKKLAALLSAALVMSSCTAYAKTLEFTIGSPDMYVSDGTIEKTILDCTPYTSNDRTLVPVRVISENFGAEVNWDDATQRVDILCNDTSITLHIGSNIASINGNEVTLDVSPELTDGRTMVPLRFISEALGKRVEYVELTEQVIISDEDYVLSVDDFDISLDDIRFYGAFKGYDLSTKESIEENLPLILSLLEEDAALACAAKKSGISPAEADFANLRTSMNKIKDLVYSFNTLFAPGIKLQTANLYGSAYFESLDISQHKENIQSIYDQNYIRVKHILLKTFDPQTAEYYDETKKAEIKQKAEDILSAIKKGEDFETLHEQYNEDDESFFYPDGLTICQNEVIPSFAKAAFVLEENEISEIVETMHGYHIIKRLPLAEFNEAILNEIKGSAISALAVDDVNIVYHLTNEEMIEKLLK